MIIRKTWFHMVSSMFGKSIRPENQARDRSALEVSERASLGRWDLFCFQLMFRHRAQGSRKNGQRSESVNVNNAVHEHHHEERLRPRSTSRRSRNHQQESKERCLECSSPCQPRERSDSCLLACFTLVGGVTEFTHCFVQRQAAEKKHDEPAPANIHQIRVLGIAINPKIRVVLPMAPAVAIEIRNRQWPQNPSS